MVGFSTPSPLPTLVRLQFFCMYETADPFATLTKGETSEIYSLLSSIPPALLSQSLQVVHSRLGHLLTAGNESPTVWNPYIHDSMQPDIIFV